jgi:hypothetical protein
MSAPVVDFFFFFLAFDSLRLRVSAEFDLYSLAD